MDNENKKEPEKKEPIHKKFIKYTKDGAKFFWDKGKEVGKKAYDNREKIATGVAGVAGTVLLVKKTADSLGITKHKTQYERTVEARKYQYYDPSSRRYFELRREPKTYELIEIDERRRTGEPIILILSDMGLLQKDW